MDLIDRNVFIRIAEALEEQTRVQQSIFAYTVERDKEVKALNVAMDRRNEECEARMAERHEWERESVERNRLQNEKYDAELKTWKERNQSNG